MSDMVTAKFHDSEISKSEDFNFSADSPVAVLHALLDGAFADVTKSFVIAGLNVQPAVPPSMNVVIKPGLAFSRVENKVLHLGDEQIISVTPAHASQQRIDTLEIRYYEQDIDPESRAFKDPTTGAISYAEVMTKTISYLEARCLAGTPGAGVAPAAETGWTKLAEVVVDAAATQIITGNIKNITARVDGEESAAWTAEKDATFALGSIEALKEAFLAHVANNITTSNTVHGIRQGHGNGFDADTLDSIESARVVFGDTLRASVQVADANDIVKSGFYRLGSQAGNAPEQGECLIAHTQMDDSDDAAFQIAFMTGLSSAISSYVRTKEGGTWGSWAKLWNADNDGAGSGLDADMVDGIQSERLVFGDNSRATVLMSDADSVVKSGFYYLGSPYTGGPTAAAHLIYHVQHPTVDNYAFQMAIERATHLTYIRHKTTTWSDWVKLWNAGNTGSGWESALLKAIDEYTPSKVMANSHTDATTPVILLYRAPYEGTLTAAKRCHGKISIYRGGTGQSLIVSSIDIHASTGYNDNIITCFSRGNRVLWGFGICTYNGERWLCLRYPANVSALSLARFSGWCSDSSGPILCDTNEISNYVADTYITLSPVYYNGDAVAMGGGVSGAGGLVYPVGTVLTARTSSSYNRGATVSLYIGAGLTPEVQTRNDGYGQLTGTWEVMNQTKIPITGTTTEWQYLMRRIS